MKGKNLCIHFGGVAPKSSCPPTSN
jgi:hypothetical protein